MIKVLMLNTVPMIYDGIGMTILNYVSNMDRSDMVVDFAVINHLEDKMRSQIEGLGAKIFELTDRNYSTLKYIKELAKVVRKEKYDVVHVHCNSCTAAIDLLGAKLGGAKRLCPHIHSTQTKFARANKMLRPLFNILYTDAFACGDKAGKWVFRDKDFVVLRNATNVEKFGYNEAYRKEYREKLHLDGKVAVGHVAHFTYAKNHEFLVDFFAEVVKRNPKYMLYLIGDGKLQDDVEKQVAELGMNDNIIFVGLTHDIPQYLSAMDMMVLPSRYEGLPNVLVEWQASGLPTLVSANVTRDSKLTDSLTFMELEKEVWVEGVLNTKVDIDRKRISKDNVEKIKAAGYSIKEQAAQLKQYYIEHLKK